MDIYISEPVGVGVQRGGNAVPYPTLIDAMRATPGYGGWKPGEGFHGPKWTATKINMYDQGGWEILDRPDETIVISKFEMEDRNATGNANC